MAGCLAIATLVLGCIGFICVCISTGTVAWKEDINYDRGTKVYIGLWRVCIESEPDDVNGIPEISLECDKDFLRPHLIEPPRKFCIIFFMFKFIDVCLISRVR